MDENDFFEKLDEKLKEYLGPIMAYINIQKTIKSFGIADHSTKPKISSGKKMPEQIGEYTIADKGCNRCGGKITWDLYDKDGGHPYPDHVDEKGNLIDCPQYNQ